MPPNVQIGEESGVSHDDGGKQPDEKDVTVPQYPEAADQKAEEGEVTSPQHSVFREQQHHIAEDQKILIHTESNTAASATTESEGDSDHQPLYPLIPSSMFHGYLIIFDVFNTQYTQFKLIAAEETTTATSVLKKIEASGERVAGVISEKTGIPTWGVVAIVILVFLVIFGIIFFCVRRFLKKRRTKDGKGKKGVDMKSVQLLGSAYKEKVGYNSLLFSFYYYCCFFSFLLIANILIMINC